MFPTVLVFDTKQSNVFTPLDGFIFLNNEIPICSVHASHVVVIVIYELFSLGSISVRLQQFDNSLTTRAISNVID